VKSSIRQKISASPGLEELEWDQLPPEVLKDFIGESVPGIFASNPALLSRLQQSQEPEAAGRMLEKIWLRSMLEFWFNRHYTNLRNALTNPRQRGTKCVVCDSRLVCPQCSGSGGDGEESVVRVVGEYFLL